MMAGWDGRISDTEIWNIVNYLRALADEQRMWRPRRRPPRAHGERHGRHWSSPTTSRCRSLRDNDGENTRG